MDNKKEKYKKSYPDKKDNYQAKKPKTVEIGEEITEKEYQRFLKYGINSSIWYVTTYGRTTHETKDRLLKKGYPNHETAVKFVNKDKITGVVETEIKNIFILEEVIENLEKNMILNDRGLVEAALFSSFSNNHAMSKIIRKLSTRGIDREMIDEEVEKLTEIYDEEEQREAEYDGVDRLASRMVESYTFVKITDPWKKKNKLMTSLVRKGYGFDLVQEWINENSEHFSS